MMLNTYRLDLHIHSCLSPCADKRMVPSKVVEKAKEKGLDGIGISDHNSAENVPSFKKAGKRRDLIVLGGIEITTQEEVHILALFDDNEDLFKFQDIIYKNLQGKNDEERFGKQILIDEEDHPIGKSDKLLMGAATLSVEETVDTIHSLKGIAIASHIDREGFSILHQLGFIPPKLHLDALEVSPKTELLKAKKEYGNLGCFEIVTFSDAHYLDEIGSSSTTFLIECVSIDEIRKAFFKEDGRRVMY